ncbi:FAD-binding protein [Candidatus Microgenomates bacterium]|nr:FAD-binding protein [Candidatus Microgenomates bacterium]
MDNKLKIIANYFGMDRVKFNESIAQYTSLNLGGPAKLFFIAFTKGEIIKMVKVCRELKLPFFIFGTGSKIMLSDIGFEGVVIKNRTKDIHILSIKGKVSKVGIGVDEALVEVDSGVSISKFVEFLDTQGLMADEFRQRPGSIGGNIFLNKSLQNKVKSIKVLNLNSSIEEIGVENLSFKKHIILSVALRIKTKERK